ncbi:MAG: UbiA family prenyltransferase [Marinilabiliales bacterium]|nr:UbiA family prenyltransferase [Marinilabiliales bacterium]
MTASIPGQRDGRYRQERSPSATPWLLSSPARCSSWLLAAFLNRLTLILSPLALIIILGYSYTKRFTPLCHLVLGLGLSLAPIGAYIAVTGTFALLPVIYSLIVLTWVSGFDIIYALQDDQFDRDDRTLFHPRGDVKERSPGGVGGAACGFVHARFSGRDHRAVRPHLLGRSTDIYRQC